LSADGCIGASAVRRYRSHRYPGSSAAYPQASQPGHRGP